MEQVLEIYEKAYDPQRPVVCMDEPPVQLVDVRADCCYREPDVSTTSMNGRAPPSCSARPCPPGAGRRPASAGRRWTGPRKSPACWKAATRTASTLVCDNLNTCTPGAFYEAFRAGAGVGQASLLHAEAWELAEHRGERTQDPAVPAPPSARRPRSPPGRSVVRRRQRAAARRGLGKLTMPVAN